MPNDLSRLLKSEISRVARKEIRLEVAPLRKADANHRSELAELKRQIKDLQRQLKSAVRLTAAPGSVRSHTAHPEESEPGRLVRFSAPAFAAHRAKLGLSAADCGLLVGASSLSIYKWEGGVQPRSRFHPAIAAFRKLGKREATANLEELKG